MTDPFVKHLRQNMIPAECKLWHYLRRKNIECLRFRRQYPLGPYIVDFVCLPARLIVEVDGGQHSWMERQDAKRTAWLESQGFRVIRFWNNEISESLEHVIESIQLELRRTPPPTPSRKGRGKYCVRFGTVRLTPCIPCRNGLRRCVLDNDDTFGNIPNNEPMRRRRGGAG